MKKFFNYILYIAASIVCVGSLVAAFYFWPYLSAVILLMTIIGIMAGFLYKFAKIIMVLEDDLSDAIDSLKEVESSMDKLLEMKLFFDTPEVQQLVANVMDTIKMARFSVNGMISRFVQRSRQKYVMLVEEDEQQRQQEEEMPQVPQGGTVAQIGKVK